MQTLVRELYSKLNDGIEFLDMMTHINRVLQQNANTVKIPLIISSLKKSLIFAPIKHYEMKVLKEGKLIN